ncbi:MAG: hypothetical protein E8D41_14195 [Nitrospira sp.]|nr:MAG: hypothetical protein E8D41_14195 [Nitrospira sp.]
MNEVFISYKREDETRVGRLVQVLESAGLSENSGSRLVFIHWHDSRKNAPQLYHQQGNYRASLSANPYGPDSTSNPYGRGLRI